MGSETDANQFLNFEIEDPTHYEYSYIKYQHLNIVIIWIGSKTPQIG